MKNAILLACCLAATFAQAQDKKPIEFKTIEAHHILPSGQVMAKDGNHAFALHANESTEVNLTLQLKSPGALKVTVTDKNHNIVRAKEFTCSQSSNLLSFAAEQGQDYTVHLYAAADTRFSVDVNSL